MLRTVDTMGIIKITQADLGDMVGLVPDHHNKVNIAVKQVT